MTHDLVLSEEPEMYGQLFLLQLTLFFLLFRTNKIKQTKNPPDEIKQTCIYQNENLQTTSYIF